MNIRKIIKPNTNYFKYYEEFKLSSGKYTSLSQVSFFIIKELLRNLKVHSSNIFEIISNFIDYIKLKEKSKKFSEKEIISLFIGINKDELFEEYYQSIFKDEKPLNKYSLTSISEKSNLSSTLNSNSCISNNSNVINIKNVNKANNNNNTIDEKILTSLEGILYYIGNFQKNYFGARNFVLLVNKIFERDFNPEVDMYIKLLNYLK